MSNEEQLDKILLNNSYWASPPTDVGKMFEIGLNEKGIKQAKAELTKLIDENYRHTLALLDRLEEQLIGEDETRANDVEIAMQARNELRQKQRQIIEAERRALNIGKDNEKT